MLSADVKKGQKFLCKFIGKGITVCRTKAIFRAAELINIPLCCLFNSGVKDDFILFNARK